MESRQDATDHIESSASDKLSTAAGILFGYAIGMQSITGTPTGDEEWRYLAAYYLGFVGVLALVITTAAAVLWFCIYGWGFASGKRNSAPRYATVLQWTTLVVCMVNLAAALYLGS